MTTTKKKAFTVIAYFLRIYILLAMYRLDRLTSGIVIMGKTFQATLLIDKHIKERTALKTYLARVIGEFPKYI